MSAARVTSLCLVVVAASCLLASPSQAKQLSALTSGRWAGGAYTDDETGQFAYCLAAAVDPNGIMMSVALTRDLTWGLVFASENWHLTAKQEIPLRIRIDAGPWLDTKAVAVDHDIVYLPMAPETTLLELFRHGHRLQLFDGETLTFDLTGTSQLMVNLAACLKTALATEQGDAKPPAAGTEVAKGEDSDGQLSSGSGLLISESGYVLTNDHVIDRCREIWVRRNGEETNRQASIVARDPANDLALLASEFRVGQGEIAAFRTGTPIRAGDAIAVYGFPLAGTLSSTGNVVSGNVTALAGLGDDVRYFQISAPIQAGNSGGPLLDYSGLVVGIVNSKLNELAFARQTGELPQNVNFAIKGTVIASFLEAHSIAYRSSPSTEKLDLPAVTERAQQFTVFVLCAG